VLQPKDLTVCILGTLPTTKHSKHSFNNILKHHNEIIKIIQDYQNALCKLDHESKMLKHDKDIKNNHKMYAIQQIEIIQYTINGYFNKKTTRIYARKCCKKISKQY